MGSLSFDQINIVVTDVEAAVAFLRALGAEIPELPAEWAQWAPHHVSAPVAAGFTADLDSSAFAAHWGGLDRSFTGVVVNLRATDSAGVDESFERALALGATSRKAPYDAFWGSRFAVVEGPGPIVVGLMGPSDQERRDPSPDISDFA
jgi:predicted lactoylglutathione lyase